MDLMDVKEAVSPSPYAHWGGLPAAVAALDEFERARAEDPQLSSIFSRLDLLDSAPRTVTDLCAAMAACNFSREEQDRINSPCLDGLMNACSSPFSSMDPRVQIGDFLLRLVHPKVFVDTLQWLLLAAANKHGSLLWANLELLLIAAGGANHVNVLGELLRCDYFAFVTSNQRTDVSILDHSLWQACCNGHTAVVQLLIGAAPDAIGDPNRLIANALQGGHLALAQLLTEFAGDRKVVLKWPSLLVNAVQSGRIPVVDFCLARGGYTLRTNHLQDAVCNAISSRSVAVVAHLLHIQPKLNVDIDHLSRAIRAVSAPTLKLLLDKRPAVLRIQRCFAQNLLIQACRSGCMPVVDVLTAAGIAQPELYKECLEPAVDSLDLPMLRHVLNAQTFEPSALRWAIFRAVAGNQMSMVDALIDKLGETGAADTDALRVQAATDPLSLLDQLPSISFRVYCDSFDLACRGGNPDMLQWLRRETPSEVHLDVSFPTRLAGMGIEAVARGHVSTFALLMTEKDVSHVCLTYRSYRSNMLLRSIEGGQETMITLIADLLHRALREGEGRCAYDVLRFALLAAASGQRSFLETACGVIRGNELIFQPAVLVLLQRLDLLTADCDDLLPYVMAICSILNSTVADWSIRGDALCAAARFGQLTTVQYLLDTGAAVQHEQNKPLKLALAHGHHVVAELLRSRGAFCDVDA